MARPLNTAPSTRDGFDLSIPCPAKVNPFLHVLGRRDDGYHELQVAFWLLNWGDTLHYAEDKPFEVEALPGVALEDNLIWQAAEALQQATGCVLSGRLGLTKRVPQGAGLGGGSSNAASTLLLLNQQLNLGLSQDDLAAIGLGLGADVPVFVRGFSGIGLGVGEELTPVDWPTRSLALFTPPEPVSTRMIFSDAGLTRDSTAINLRAALELTGHNDCEVVARRKVPNVERLFQSLRGRSPRLSGTGGTVFVEVDGPDDYDQLCQQVDSQVTTHLCSTCNTSPAFQQRTTGVWPSG